MWLLTTINTSLSLSIYIYIYIILARRSKVITEDGKEKKLTIDFEPFKPINTTMCQDLQPFLCLIVLYLRFQGLDFACEGKKLIIDFEPFNPIYTTMRSSLLPVCIARFAS